VPGATVQEAAVSETAGGSVFDEVKLAG
jgi:hypothetical protein